MTFQTAKRQIGDAVKDLRTGAQVLLSRGWGYGAKRGATEKRPETKKFMRFVTQTTQERSNDSGC